MNNDPENPEGDQKPLVSEAKESLIPVPERPTDQEVADQKETELDAARELHNQKTGGGAYPVSDPNKSSAV